MHRQEYDLDKVRMYVTPYTYTVQVMCQPAVKGPDLFQFSATVGLTFRYCFDVLLHRKLIVSVAKFVFDTISSFQADCKTNMQNFLNHVDVYNA